MEIPSQLLLTSLCFNADSYCVAVFVISTIIMLSTAGGNAQRNEHIKHLEAENKELRAKLDFYAATVDSIYKRLDTLQVIINSDSKDYPSLDFEQQLKPNYTFDPALKNRMEELETKLATILVVISDPVTSNYTSTLEASESRFYSSIYPSFGRIGGGWGLHYCIQSAMILNFIIGLILPINLALLYMQQLALLLLQIMIPAMEKEL